MTKIFISGATSSIGGHLVNLLLQEEVILHLLVRSKKSCTAFIHPKIVLFEGDLSAIEVIQAAMDGCDQVYHLAAIASVWLKDESAFFKVNVAGTSTILAAAVKAQVKKVVVTSSAGVYGPSISSSIHENKLREVDFFNAYESSKSLAELVVHQFIATHGIDVVIVAPTRVYGPHLNGPVGSTTLLIEKYVNGSWRVYPGTGNEIGNYAYIEDVAAGHRLAMLKGKSGEHYILGGENCSYVAFFQQLANVSTIRRKMVKIPTWVQFLFSYLELMKAKVFGIAPSITPKWIAKGIYNWEVESIKAIRELGYTITPLAKGLQKTVESVVKNAK